MALEGPSGFWMGVLSQCPWEFHQQPEKRPWRIQLSLRRAPLACWRFSTETHVYTLAPSSILPAVNCCSALSAAGRESLICPGRRLQRNAWRTRLASRKWRAGRLNTLDDTSPGTLEGGAVEENPYHCVCWKQCT